MPPIFLKGAPAPIPQGESPDKAETELPQASPAEGMVERVAKAIQDVKGGLNYDYADFCRDAARAAIEAMRKPTEAMKAVFSSARPESPKTVWHLVIDAALSEKGA